MLRGEVATAFVSVATCVALIVTAVLLFVPYREGTAFAQLFITDRLTTTMKALVLIGSAVAILMSRAYFERVKAWRFEYPLIVSLATLGMMLMISANDLMSLYVGLELQSLALYVIAAFQRDSVRSTEAGLKYFVLGSVASGMLLFGASLIYGFCGSTAFVQISQALLAGKAAEIGTADRPGVRGRGPGLQDRRRAVPHVDARRLRGRADAGHGLLRRGAQDRRRLAARLGPDGPVQAAVPRSGSRSSSSPRCCRWAGAPSRRCASTNIKRLMAYSSIANVGYVLLGVAAGSEKGIQSVVFYLAIYMVMTLGVFAIILLMKRRDVMVENISDLAGPRPQPSDAGLVDADLHVLAGRHPAARRLLGQALRLHGGRRGQAVLAGRARRAGLGRGVLLLPAHRQGDVLRRERPRRSTRRPSA